MVDVTETRETPSHQKAAFELINQLGLNPERVKTYHDSFLKGLPSTSFYKLSGLENRLPPEKINAQSFPLFHYLLLIKAVADYSFWLSNERKKINSTYKLSQRNKGIRFL